MQNSETDLYTPLYKIFFLFSFCTIILFGTFWALIQSRNQELELAYQELNLKGQKSFSTLTGYHQIISENQKRHVYTYLVTDEIGSLHEVTEYVDSKSHLRLRVGNTVVTRQRKFKLAGKERILSRIEGNNQILPNYDFLEKIALVGIAFSTLIGCIGIFLFIFKRKQA